VTDIAEWDLEFNHMNAIGLLFALESRDEFAAGKDSRRTRGIILAKVRGASASAPLSPGKLTASPPRDPLMNQSCDSSSSAQVDVK
jgi:hypothetical protein